MSHTITHATYSTLPGRRASSPLWTMVIMVLLCFIMIATSSCSLNLGNTTTTTNTNTHADSHNNICNGILNCPSVNVTFNISVTLNEPYHTINGTAICNGIGNLWVNGSPASPATNPKQEVIVVYKGSGGTIEARYTPGICNQFPISVAPNTINSIVNNLKTECQNLHICPGGYYERQYNT